MTAADPAPPPLTLEQAEQAAAVFRYLLALRAAGVRQAIVTLDGEKIAARPAGERVDIAFVPKTPYNGRVSS